MVVQLTVSIDMLDEFSAATVDSKSNAPKSVVPERVENHVTPGLSDAVTSDFSKQLQEQMAALMGEIDESPGVRQEIEVMMQEIGAAVDSEPKAGLGSSSGVTANTATSSSGAEEPFQETIRKTMERMQASGEQAAAAASEDSEDILAQMLKEMEGGDINGAGDEGKFSKMLMGMMEQLTNRDILYEPMKELHEKFPAWMSKNGSSTDRGDLRRYEEQQRLVGEIVGKFEAKGYSDSNPTDREFIVERMQQVSFYISIFNLRVT